MVNVKQINYNWFEEKLYKETEEILSLYKQRYNINDMSGFALYSDASAMSISVSINTHDFYQTKIKKYPGNDYSFKFSPGEWQFEMFNVEAMDELNSFLQNTYFEVSKHEYEFVEHRKKIYEIAVIILDRLKIKNEFPTEDQFVLLLSMSDYTDRDLEIGYVRRLNSPTISDEFEYWIKNEVFDEDEDEDIDFDALDADLGLDD